MGTPSRFALLAALPAVGCLDTVEAPPEQTAMCEIDADCDAAAGEVCDEGICWGNPPDEAQFAAMLVPPEERPDLATAEFPELSIAADGTIENLEFPEPVTVTGRVVLACDETLEQPTCGDETSVAAQIRVTRPSVIPGAPALSRTVMAQPAIPPGEAAFTLELPATGAGDPPYQVTVTPVAAGDGTETDAGPALPALAAPLRTSLEASESTQVTWTLGDPSATKRVTGQVVDAAGRGLLGMRVTARGRWEGSRARERVSSVATTDADGWFAIRIPLAVEDTMDLVAQPAPDMVAPTLRTSGVTIPDPDAGQLLEPIAVDAMVMPSYPAPTDFALPVEGSGSGGGTVPVPGAEVEMSVTLPSAPGTAATFQARATTDPEDGVATFQLIPAGEENRTYNTRVMSPPTSQYASVWELETAVGPGSQGDTSFLAAVPLEHRVPIQGRVVANDGLPIAGASVAASASTGFRWSLDLAAQSLLDGVQFPTATTDDAGSFVLWLDPLMAGRSAVYDLDVVPPAPLGAPRWSRERVDIAQVTGEDKGELAPVELPPASYARGTATAGGEPIPGAELWLYHLADDAGICDGANLPDGESCEPPARLRGLWRSRDSGEVWVVLPDPP